MKYALHTKEPDDPAFFKGVDEKNPVQSLLLKAALHGPTDKVNAYHIRQSWSKTDSNMMTPEDFNQIGRSLVEKKFPGHVYLCVTHTETGKIHNHIVVCPWHSETGRKIEDKKKHLYDLRKISDDLCRESGLSVISQKDHERQADLPEKVQKIERDRGASWLHDLCQKADFARAYATSYDEYTAILREMGVKARVEEKSISYFYKDNTRAKRGSKLGRVYDKEGLEKSFQANDEKFHQIQGLREQVLGAISAHATGESSTRTTQKALGNIAETTYTKGQRDYSAYTKTARAAREAKAGRAVRYPHELDIAGSIIPVDVLRRARNANIPEYCARHKIELVNREDGQRSLKGREHVLIGDHDWQNTKNGTRGSLIELVAAHKDLTFLQAVVEITNNKRLLVLEEQFGEVKRPYKSFYIPKELQDRDYGGRDQLGSLLEQNGIDKQLADTLIRSDLVQVGDVDDAVIGDDDHPHVVSYDQGDRYKGDAGASSETTANERGEGGDGDANSDEAGSADAEVEVEAEDKSLTQRGQKKSLYDGIAPTLRDLARKSPAATTLPGNQEEKGKVRVIRFFAKADPGGSYEYQEAEDKTWRRRKLGMFSKPFFKVSKGSSQARVFLDPVAFLRANGKRALSPTNYATDTICLMEPRPKALDHFLAQNPRIRELEIFTSKAGKQTQTELDFFENLKKRYQRFSLNVQLGREEGLGRDRSPDIPSL